LFPKKGIPLISFLGGSTQLIPLILKPLCFWPFFKAIGTNKAYLGLGKGKEGFGPKPRLNPLKKGTIPRGWVGLRGLVSLVGKKPVPLLKP